ncbi:trihelix transcription factor ENAP1-like [Arachis stenosperma]|uniref:trihelix transcription factor ENAP1-like n=1 Tax=Arachis stenosperma TaxID=217475 RepID=UPI0025AB804F|nr:trihelix transcription factor ENAP1-like [Arachis stenosperma]
MGSPAEAPSPDAAPASSPPPPPPPTTTRPSPFPGREDCWSEEATSTLIDAWGSRYLSLSRGSLRQNHWQEVAAAVNAAHGHDPRHRRTDVQCKNRIDTLKKKYKVERARVSDSTAGDDDGDGRVYSGTWSFFHRIDSLIGDTYPLKKQSPPVKSSPRLKSPPAAKPSPPPWTVTPVGPRSGTKKRAAPMSSDDTYFRRKFSAFAAAAVAAAAAESEDSKGSSEKRRRVTKNDEEWEIGYRELAHAIEKVGEIYERVEAAKRKQMVELEKQRMQFAKDLECQRLKLFMETQLHIHKINNHSSNDAADSFS